MTSAPRRSSSLPSLPPARHPAFRRLRTAPDLLPRPDTTATPSEGQRPRRMTKLLVNVTVGRSLGAVQVVLPPGSRVADLIRATVEVYVREGRRPLLDRARPEAFELHYSKFSLESLDPEEEVMKLGSRNFFLCSKELVAAGAMEGGGPGDCRGDEGRMASATAVPRPRFMDLFLKLRS